MGTPWRKYYTQVLDNTFLMNDNNAFLVFMKLMASANNRGEYACSGREMADRFNITYSACRHALDRLAEQKIISVFATPRGKKTIYKISNWQKYQGSQQRATQKKAQPEAQELTGIDEVVDAQPEAQETEQPRRSHDAEHIENTGVKTRSLRIKNKEDIEATRKTRSGSGSHIAFEIIANKIGTRAKPEDNGYILEVITELLKRHTLEELEQATEVMCEDTWVKEKRPHPSDKLRYFFFTQTKSTNREVKIANSVERVASFITKAQETEPPPIEHNGRKVIREVFGGYQ